MNPDATTTVELVTQPMMTDYVDSMTYALTWAVPFILGLVIAAYAALFFVRVLYTGSSGKP